MSSENSDENKQYEIRLQRRLQILKQELEAGRVHIAKGLQVIESLKKVRYAPDGTVDLNTVDSFVRSMALGIQYQHDREEAKKAAPLVEIQTAYFNFIENNFGSFYKAMLERKLTPHDVATALSGSKSSVEQLTKDLSAFLEFIEEFWSQTADAAHAHVEDMHDSLKGVFGGDLFPSHGENIASKCGIYADTIILPDPFLRSKHVFEYGSPQQRAYYLIKHGLNLLQYKELACADVTPPIVVIVPDRTGMDEAEKQFIFSLGQEDALVHAGRVFGRRFEQFDELIEFASSLDTIERVEAEVVDRQRVLFDTEWEGDFRSKLKKATTEDAAALLGTSNPGVIIANQALGRMGTSNELLIKARRLRGTPIIDAPTSWQYFVWKLEYDARSMERQTGVTDLHILHGLQSAAENEMEWLGRVPPHALIDIRKAGALGEIRDILSRGVRDLAFADPANFRTTTDQVFENINAAFTEHKKNIDALRLKKWKFAGTDVGSWLVVGSLAITAAATGLPVWGLAAFVAEELLPAPKLRELPQSMKELAKESRELRQSPVGMLFNYSRRKA